MVYFFSHEPSHKQTSRKIWYVRRIQRGSESTGLNQYRKWPGNIFKMLKWALKIADTNIPVRILDLQYLWSISHHSESYGCFYRYLKPAIFKDSDASQNKIQCPKNAYYDKKTELGAEERIPIFFSESPPFRGCDILRQGQNINHLKNLWNVWPTTVLEHFLNKFLVLTFLNLTRVKKETFSNLMSKV